MVNKTRKSRSAAVFLTAVSMALASGCGTSEVGDVSVRVSTQGLSPSDVAWVVVTVNCPGAAGIELTLTPVMGQFGGIIGGIPAGNCTISARAYDQFDTVIYEAPGQVVTIVPGFTPTVFLLLQQAIPPDVFVNSVPRIVAVTTSDSQVDPGQTVNLTLNVVDPDGDPLTYAWTSTCGTLSDPSVANPTWTAPMTEAVCTLEVSVTDGRGGQTGISIMVSVVAAKGGFRLEPIQFNTWPVVSQVSASPGQVNPGEGVRLDVTAADPDGDALTYQWTDDCGGSFDDPNAKSPLWIAPEVAPATGRCTLQVKPLDGRGGSTTGVIIVQIGLPGVPTPPPIIDLTYQSADVVAAGGDVVLAVTAHDPKGSFFILVFEWEASGGTLGPPDSTTSSSQVTWTAPATSGSYTITVRVTDQLGVETTHQFIVTVP
jgi:hypothetical protein